MAIIIKRGARKLIANARVDIGYYQNGVGDLYDDDVSLPTRLK